MTLDEGHYHIYFLLRYHMETLSFWLWKSLKNLGNFFSYFVATLCMLLTVRCTA